MFEQKIKKGALESKVVWHKKRYSAVSLSVCLPLVYGITVMRSLLTLSGKPLYVSDSLGKEGEREREDFCFFFGHFVSCLGKGGVDLILKLLKFLNLAKNVYSMRGLSLLSFTRELTTLFSDVEFLIPFC